MGGVCITDNRFTGFNGRGKSYIRLKLLRIRHAACSNPVSRDLGGPCSRLGNNVQGVQVGVGVVAEVLSRVRDENVAEVRVGTVRDLPVSHGAHVDSLQLVVEGLSQEAQVSRLQHPVHVVVSRQQRCAHPVFQVVTPHLRRSVVLVRHRRVAAVELPTLW